MKRIVPLLVSIAIPSTACQESEGCVEVSRTMVTDPGDELLIGGTYGDVLATAVGERAGTMAWQQSDSWVRGFPPAGSTGITVDVHEPTMAWDIEIERRARRNERLLCTHSMEAEFEVVIESDDGMLDATVLVPATLSSPDSVQIYTDVTAHDLGMLTFDPIDEDASLRLRLSYGSDRAPEGALVLSSGSSDDDGSGAGMTVELATWTLE